MTIDLSRLVRPSTRDARDEALAEQRADVDVVEADVVRALPAR